MSSSPKMFTRRRLLASGTTFAASTLAAPAVLAQIAGTTEPDGVVNDTVRRNMMGFRAHSWEPYFDTLNNGAILVDTSSRALHYWDEAGALRIYPTSVPMSEDLTRRGRTEITRKVVGPSWAPTPSMKRRNPDWPDRIPPGPDNPLGTHALHLSWTYYRIHGTHDTRKIGRRSSNGCIGLYNEDIAELFDMTSLGTQVVLI